jgi:hypothetical protein
MATCRPSRWSRALLPLYKPRVVARLLVTLGLLFSSVSYLSAPYDRVGRRITGHWDITLCGP